MSKKDLLNKSCTRAAKALAQQQLFQAQKVVWISVNHNKWKYIEELARQAQDVATQKNMKDLYDTTKRQTGKYK